MVWKSDYWWLGWLTVPLLCPSPAAASSAAAAARFFAGLFLTWLGSPAFSPVEQLFRHRWSEYSGGGKETCRAGRHGGSYFGWPCCQKKHRSFFHLNAAPFRSTALNTLVHGLPSSPFRLIMETRIDFPAVPKQSIFFLPWRSQEAFLRTLAELLQRWGCM